MWIGVGCLLVLVIVLRRCWRKPGRHRLIEAFERERVLQVYNRGLVVLTDLRIYGSDPQGFKAPFERAKHWHREELLNGVLERDDALRAAFDASTCCPREPDCTFELARQWIWGVERDVGRLADAIRATDQARDLGRPAAR